MILMVGLGIAQPHTPANLIMNARQSGACLFLSRYLIIFQGSNYDLGIPMAIKRCREYRWMMMKIDEE